MTEGNFDLSNEETNKEYAIKKINNEDSIVESLSEPEKVDAIKSGDLAGLVINADMLENIMEYSNSTYGDAFGEAGTSLGALGILGPTRMDYAGSMAAVGAVARYVGRFISEGSYK